jgi:aldose 1-epimerase
MKKNLNVLLAMTILAASCNNNTTTEEKTEAKFSVTEKAFDNFESKPVTEYTLTNPSGMQVSIINYGGTVTKILAPDKQGKLADVVLGFESLDGYLQKGDPYFGSLIRTLWQPYCQCQISISMEKHIR